MKILIGTKNQGKIEGANEAFRKYYKDFEIEAVSVNSEVSDEPVDEEIYLGAKNRANNLIEYAKKNNIQADFYIAVESGITNKLGKWIIINVAVIIDKNGFESFGTSSGFPVPDKYVKEIIETELGKVMDKIFNQRELRKGKGGISFLTKNEITRIDLSKDAFIMALTQFINEDVWR